MPEPKPEVAERRDWRHDPLPEPMEKMAALMWQAWMGHVGHMPALSSWPRSADTSDRQAMRCAAIEAYAIRDAAVREVTEEMVERAAIALYDHDEYANTELDREQNLYLGKRYSWAEHAELWPATAEGFRSRARAALTAALREAEKP